MTPSAKSSMVTVDEALALILSHAPAPEVERVGIAAAIGRTVAAPVFALTANLPFRASAMDGYASRFGDANKGARLRIIGVAAAGTPFQGALGPNDVVRIFTGGVAPSGADHVIIQEDVTREGEFIVVASEQPQPANIREPGEDFRLGDVILQGGVRVTPIMAALAASANAADFFVARRPRVFFFGSGDELVAPGSTETRDGKVISSTPYAISALLDEFGAEPIDGGVARDNFESLDEMFGRAIEAGADIITPIGGASVGDHDLVRGAATKRGFSFVFEKIAVKPGKPTWLARDQRRLVLGLPGNPASALVCAILFLAPLIRKMTGARSAAWETTRALLGAPLDKNGPREHFLRAKAFIDERGAVRVRSFPNQDSALLSPLANANCLIRRFSSAPAAAVDEIIEIVPIGCFGGIGL